MIFLSFHWKAGMWLLIPLLPPSSGRRWRVAPEVGFVLFAFGQPPALRASPFHGKGVDSFHPASPSFLWKEVARSAGGWLRSISPSATPPALRASPFHGKGGDGLLIPFLPPSFGRRWRVAPEVGFALFRLRPTPCPSSMPLPWEGAWYEMTGISTLSHCKSKSGPRIGVRQSFQPASVRWFYCTHLGQKTQGKS